MVVCDEQGMAVAEAVHHPGAAAQAWRNN